MIQRASQWVYDHSPVLLQNMFCTLAGNRYEKLRYGQEYDRWASFYAESGSWSECELREYQREQLSLLLRECFAHVPYYRTKWKNAGVAPEDFRELPDIALADVMPAVRHGFTPALGWEALAEEGQPT